MIFVTVGTHEQQFNRLIKAVDELVEDGTIKEKVIVQKGFSDYEPRHCETYKLIGYKKMQQYLDEASLVISHGGPASFMAALERGKKPIVMPRLKTFKEHINDHQDSFCRYVEKEYHSIILVNSKQELKRAIINRGSVAKKQLSQNEVFNKRIQRILEKI